MRLELVLLWDFICFRMSGRVVLGIWRVIRESLRGEGCLQVRALLYVWISLVWVWGCMHIIQELIIEEMRSEVTSNIIS